MVKVVPSSRITVALRAWARSFGIRRWRSRLTLVLSVVETTETSLLPGETRVRSFAERVTLGHEAASDGLGVHGS